MSFLPIVFVIPLQAVAKGRARHSSSGHVYTPPKTVDFENSVRWYWVRHKHTMLPEVATVLTVTVYIPRPKKPKNNSRIPITKPDVDNYAKSIEDALNKFAWKDDSQVSFLQIKKRYTDQAPRIEILITPDSE